MKKSISIILAISIVFGFAVPVSAMTGAGTELNPYMISTPADLMAISDDLSAHYKLVNDIDMSGVYDYKPIGNAADGAFTGSLDGNGFAIKNLTIDLPGEKYTGLFGYSEGDISNLTLSNVYIIGGRYVGGIAGYSGTNGSINDCSVNVNLSSQEALIDVNIGGIAGAYSGTMENCQSEGKVLVSDNNVPCYAGGLVGTTCGTISFLKSDNHLNINVKSRSGGFVGNADSTISFTNCNNYGVINSQGLAGGFIGFSAEYINLTFLNCNNYNSIIGNSGAGGFVGETTEVTFYNCKNLGRIFSNGNTGGFTGTAYSLTINKCVNLGSVDGGLKGGFAGYIYSATISNSYNAGQIGEESQDRKSSSGGFIGGTQSSYNLRIIIIENCYNSGSVYTGITTNANDHASAGGFVGSINLGSDLVINNCYNTGNVLGTGTGGFLGTSNSSSYNHTKKASFLNCYNSGLIDGELETGSIYASVYGSVSLSDVYALKDQQKNFYYDVNRNISFLNAEEMKNNLSYSNWDFEKAWYIDPNINNGYPVLRCFEDEQYSMDKSILTLEINESSSLTPYHNGEPIEAVSWVSSDTSIVNVTSDGTVIANGAGTASITAITSDGYKINSSISVIKPCRGITLNDVKVNMHGSISVTAKLNDSSSNEWITDWQSSDTSIATVSLVSFNLISVSIAAKNVGTCEITATSILGEKATFVVTVTSNAESISFSSKSTTINRGKTKTLTATVRPSPTQSTLTWSSSNESIATVDQNGVVTGVSAGQAIITVMTDTGYSATCTVTVNVPAETLTMDKSAVTVTKGYTDKVVATPYPLDTTDTITYSTSSSSIVSVNSSTGVITGKSAGTATITATASSGAKAYCTVTVVNPTIPVTGITLDREEINIHAGELVTLSPQVVPSGATNQQLIWSVADESVATVNQTGVVKGIAEGSTVVTATTVDGGYSVSCTVNVIIDVVAIKLDKDHLDMNSNEKASLIATVMPDNASNKNVIWSSSEESIAKVDQNGVVTAVSQGVAVITAKTQDWNKIATCFVNVTEPVDTVRISSTSASVVLDKSITLTASVLPENATYPEISWSSSDNSVASVDENGVVTAHKLGIATITATAHNGKYTKCEIYAVSFEGAEYTDFVCEKTADGTGVIIKEYCGTSSDVIIPRAIGNLPVTTLGNALFVNCEQTIETLTIPETVTTIDVNSFGSSVGLVRCYEYSAAHEYAAANNLNYELIYEMTLSAQSATLYRGDEKQLSVAITPSAMANSAISWSSSNNSVATVSDNGLIVANMQGTAIITATDEFGNDVTCRVRVIPRTPTIYIYNFDRSYEWKLDWWKPYSSAKMKLTYYSYNCEDAVRFEWSSSNKRVKIDSAGNITNTGFFGRSSIITIKAYDAQGNVIASSDVKVMFYKFKWQKDRLQTQAIVSDNYLDRDVPEQTLDKTVENETVAVFSYFIEYMERIFKFLIF